MAKIISNEKVSEGIYLMKIEGSFEAKPGQFYMLNVPNKFLARPISIFDADDISISFLYQKKGEGTTFMSTMLAGQEIELFGSLGNGFDMERIKGEQLTLIGGGIGIAPLYLLAKEFTKQNPTQKLNIYLGFTLESYVVDSFKAISDNVVVNIGGIITHDVDWTQSGYYITCGPHKMMESCYDYCKTNNQKLIVSLESHMACGVGACLGCNCKTPFGQIKICKDGPVFDSNQVFG